MRAMADFSSSKAHTKLHLSGQLVCLPLLEEGTRCLVTRSPACHGIQELRQALRTWRQYARGTWSSCQRH